MGQRLRVAVSREKKVVTHISKSDLPLVMSHCPIFHQSRHLWFWIFDDGIQQAKHDWCDFRSLSQESTSSCHKLCTVQWRNNVDYLMPMPSSYLSNLFLFIQKYVPYTRKIYPRTIRYLRFINCRHFLEVWRHSFDIIRLIFERGLFSGEGKSCASTVFYI